MTNQLSTLCSRRHTSRSSHSKKTTTATTARTMMTAYLCFSSSLGGRSAAAFVVRNASPSSAAGRARGYGIHQRSIVPIVVPTMARFVKARRLSATTADVADAASPSPSLTKKHVGPYDLYNKEVGLGTYTPSEFEREVYGWWEESGCFQPDAKQSAAVAEKNGRLPYVLPMPPPNVTGRLHMGHAIFVALQDILARFHRMRGRPVLWLPGRFYSWGRAVYFLQTSSSSWIHTGPMASVGRASVLFIHSSCICFC